MRKAFDHPYRVVRYDTDENLIQELAQCAHFDLAAACQDQATKIWPHDEIAVQHGIRIMTKKGPYAEGPP